MTEGSHKVFALDMDRREQDRRYNCKQQLQWNRLLTFVYDVMRFVSAACIVSNLPRVAHKLLTFRLQFPFFIIRLRPA